MMTVRFRNTVISLFVVIWLTVFTYESIRYFYLQPLLRKPLPKTKFLFPPAGWIMFFNVDDRAGYAEVYGIKNGLAVLIDPHEIIKTRFIGFDMVQRNVLSTILEPRMRSAVCPVLKRQFPEFERFVVTAVEYPSLQNSRYDRVQIPIYQCP